MPIADLVYSSDLKKCCSAPPPPPPPPEPKCNCAPDERYYPNYGCCPPPPPPPIPYYPYPYPICPPPNPDVKINKSSIEAQICRLSKKSAAIKKMIENFEEKNRDAILKIGDTSYNFASYKIITKGPEGAKVEEDSPYGETILTDLLKKELDAIKTKLVELTNDLEEEVGGDAINSGTEKTVAEEYAF